MTPYDGREARHTSLLSVLECFLGLDRAHRSIAFLSYWVTRFWGGGGGVGGGGGSKQREEQIVDGQGAYKLQHHSFHFDLRLAELQVVFCASYGATKSLSALT